MVSFDCSASFSHLVHNNLTWWYQNRLFSLCSRLIESKMQPLYMFNESHKNNVAFFIDCQCISTDRFAGGPASAGINAERYDPFYQRSFYNGWKSIHGLKYQTLESPLGLCVDLFGPISLRRHDRFLYRESNIHLKIKSLSLFFRMFGDSAYLLDTNMSSYIDSNIEIIKIWNKAMKSVRISNEWAYANTCNLFKYLYNIFKLKILKNPVIFGIYTVCTLFRNFHVILYGSEISNYFNVCINDIFLELYIIKEIYKIILFYYRDVLGLLIG